MKTATNHKRILPSRDVLLNQSQGIVSALDLSASSSSTEGTTSDTWNDSDSLGVDKDDNGTESLDENSSVVDVEC